MRDVEMTVRERSERCREDNERCREDSEREE